MLVFGNDAQGYFDLWSPDHYSTIKYVLKYVAYSEKKMFKQNLE